MNSDLDKMYDIQKWTQANVYKTLPLNEEEWSEADRAMFVKDNVLAALDELHESLAEVGWKPWATSRHVNEDALQGELVDVFHFFMNLMFAARMTPETLVSRYLEKNKKNIQRQQDGYDGVQGKCPNCRRAYDDVAVSCLPAEKDQEAMCAFAR